MDRGFSMFCALKSKLNIPIKYTVLNLSFFRPERGGEWIVHPSCHTRGEKGDEETSSPTYLDTVSLYKSKLFIS